MPLEKVRKRVRRPSLPPQADTKLRIAFRARLDGPFEVFGRWHFSVLFDGLCYEELAVRERMRNGILKQLIWF